MHLSHYFKQLIQKLKTLSIYTFFQDFERFLLILSILPFLLNWIIGILLIKDTQKMKLCYFSSISGILFILLSSVLYFIYTFFYGISFQILVNSIFLLLQIFLIALYLFFSFKIFQFYKKQQMNSIILFLNRIFESFQKLLY